MARDSDGLAVRKWAKSETALALAPTDITPADGLPASYGVDSFISLEVFNYLWRQVTALGEDVAKHGVLEWDAAQEYLHPSFVVGSDTNLYQSVQASGGSNTSQDPTTDDGTYWTPASSLDIANASETVPGIIRTATVSEALAGTSVSTAVTPEALAAVTSQLLANAVNDVTTEPGEYVFSESEARTWPWNTTKGRAIISYADEGDSRLDNLTLQSEGVQSSSRGLANDGSTFWITDKLVGGVRQQIRAWTIDGVRDSDKDLEGLRNLEIKEGITYHNNGLLLFIRNASSNDGVYTIDVNTQDEQSVISFSDTDDRRGLTTDGATIWVVNNTQNTAQAYSVTDWSRQTDKDIPFGSDADWGDAATNNTTLWVRQNKERKSGGGSDRTVIARAWDIATKARDAEKDFFGDTTLRDAESSDGLTVVDGSVLHMARIIRLGVGQSRNVLERLRTVSGRELVVGNVSYGVDIPGQHELTGISQGDTIRATLKEDEDFAIVYPVY